MTSIHKTKLYYNIPYDFVRELLIEINGTSITRTNPSVILAGSSVLSLLDSVVKPNDYDLFVLDERTYLIIVRTLTSKGYSLFKQTDFAETFAHSVYPTIQLIKAYNRTPQFVLNCFDINICKVATDGLNLYFSSDVKAAITTKIISVCGPIPNPRHTLFRLMKYAQRGYSIDNAIAYLYSIIVDRAAHGKLPDLNDEYVQMAELFVEHGTEDKDDLF